jgi:acetate---CoA ligase (ADP-forming) subunit alpha
MTSDIGAELDAIFYPKSVSIIGASSREGSFGRLFLEGFKRMEFQEIYPVNPREEILMGLKTYPSITDIPYEVDLAILLIPQSETLKVVRECAKKGVKGIILFAAGFGEKSPEGRLLEQHIAQEARRYGTRVIGPNTTGIFSSRARVCTLASPLILGGLPTGGGGVSLVAQSGSFNDFLSIVLTRNNIKVGKAVGSGNECDLGSEDFIEYFGADRETELIAGYLEGVKDGRRFYEICKNVSKTKPIILWKGGLTETGAGAALAHTGKLAGSKKVWEAMTKQAGIVSVNSFDEIVDCIMAFSWMPLPKGKRTAILSGMGGTNIGTADNCIFAGLEIANFSEDTCRKLEKEISAAGTAISNPLDIGVGAVMNQNLYGTAVKILAEDENVDMILAVNSPINHEGTISLAEAVNSVLKPAAVALFDIPDIVEPEIKYLSENRVPVYRDPKRACNAMFKLADYAAYRNTH